MQELITNVITWADEKNLLQKENSFKQLAKTMEELGETAGAIAKNQPEKIKDGIGDVVVTLIILAAQNNLSINDCLQAAWEEIKDRKGTTVGGVFIKEADIEKPEPPKSLIISEGSL